MQVRAVVRDPAKRAATGRSKGQRSPSPTRAIGQHWRRRCSGSDGAFIMMPTFETAGDAEHRRLADSIAGAVADSGVPHVVLLSSIGAELVDGTGPIRWLHHLEDGLSKTGAVVSAIRSWHFQEKVEDVLGVALEAGIYPVFGEDADVPTPMVATRDIGKVRRGGAPRATSRQRGHRPATGPSTPNERSPTSWQPRSANRSRSSRVPRAGWVDAMLEAGLPAPFAHELAALYAAAEQGVFRSCGDRQVLCTTPIGETLHHVVAAARLPAA